MILLIDIVKENKKQFKTGMIFAIGYTRTTIVTYFLGACADPGNKMAESNES